MWNEQIELGVTPNPIVLGDPNTPTQWDPVYANKKSIKQAEFYKAAGVGLSPEMMFEIHSFEYSGNQYVRYDGKIYSILRTYEIPGTDRMELVLTSSIGR